MPLTGGSAWSVSAPQQRRPLASAEGRIGSSTSGTFGGGVGAAAGGGSGGGTGGGSSLGSITGDIGDLIIRYNSYMAAQAPTIAGLQGQNALAEIGRAHV